MVLPFYQVNKCITIHAQKIFKSEIMLNFCTRITKTKNMLHTSFEDQYHLYITAGSLTVWLSNTKLYHILYKVVNHFCTTGHCDIWIRQADTAAMVTSTFRTLFHYVEPRVIYYPKWWWSISSIVLILVYRSIEVHRLFCGHLRILVRNHVGGWYYLQWRFATLCFSQFIWQLDGQILIKCWRSKQLRYGLNNHSWA